MAVVNLILPCLSMSTFSCFISLRSTKISFKFCNGRHKFAVIKVVTKVKQVISFPSTFEVGSAILPLFSFQFVTNLGLFFFSYISMMFQMLVNFYHSIFLLMTISILMLQIQLNCKKLGIGNFDMSRNGLRQIH